MFANNPVAQRRGLLRVLLLCGLTALACLPASAQGTAGKKKISISQVVPLDFPKFDVFFTVRNEKGEVLPADGMAISVVPASVVPSSDPPQRLDGISTVLLIDKSGSMQDRLADGQTTKIDALKKALSLFVDRMTDSDRCALVIFGSTVPDVSQIQWSNKQQAKEQVDALTADHDVTRLYDAIDAALKFLEQQGKQKRTSLILMTDGFNNIWQENGQGVGQLETDADLKALLDRAKTAGVRFDTLGFGQDNDAPRPDPAKRRDSNKKVQDEYWAEAEKFLDKDTLNKLAQVNNPDGKAVITPDEDTLKNFYTGLIDSYHREYVLHCTGQSDIGQDIDPGIHLEAKQDGETAMSNVVQLAYIVPMAPPPGHPKYAGYALKRVVVFGVLMTALVAAWWAPLMSGKVFGDAKPTAQSLKQDSSQAQTYWQHQAQMNSGAAQPPRQQPPSYAPPSNGPGFSAAPAQSAPVRTPTAPITPMPAPASYVSPTPTSAPPSVPGVPPMAASGGASAPAPAGPQFDVGGAVPPNPSAPPAPRRPAVMVEQLTEYTDEDRRRGADAAAQPPQLPPR